MQHITVALAGNPNAGKTTVFNALTGSRQHVGNYPGVTVEKKEGIMDWRGVRFTIIDLPGTYSLSAASPEEVVARDFLIGEKPDVVIQVLDASNLDRNLFLATQLMELGVRLVFALNMTDVAKQRGLKFDIDAISQQLRSPVVPTVGNREEGMDDLLAAALHASTQPTPRYQEIQYPKNLIKAVDAVDAILTGKDRDRADRYPPRWLAARLLENDADMARRIADPNVLEQVAHLREQFEKENGDPPEIRTAESKYGWIAGLAAETVHVSPQKRSDVSDAVDSVVLHRLFGLPIFLLLMYLMFHLVFTLAEPPMGWIETAFGYLGDHIARLWPRSADSPLRDLIVSGIISGVGGVLVFLPNILLLFLAIAFLEGTGYMARAAFIMDSLMHRIGLHGKSFIPMLLGFGCTVPAIMSCRTLENRKDRLTTILVLPFMSCGARLPIYALIIPAFFPEYLRAWMLWLMYVIGVVFAIVGAKALRSTVFKGDGNAFVMELPPYRMPTLRSVLVLMWERAWEYVKKAGTIILGVSILLWAMTTYPKKPEFDQEYGALRDHAYREMLAGAETIGRAVGIGQDGALLVRWAEAVHEKQEQANLYWENEPGYQNAINGFAERVAVLEQGKGGDALAEFIRALEGYDAAESRFTEVTKGEVPGSERFYGAEAVRERNIQGIDASPVMLAAAERFRNGPYARYREQLESFDNAESGEEIDYSVSGRIGHAIEPLLKPLGFDWRVGTAIIGSFAAKEVFVAQMGIVYSVGETDEESETLREKLRENYTPLQAFCMMLYCLLSVPCVATLAVTRRESGDGRYAVAMLLGYTVVAYVATLIVHQAGSLLGIGV